MGQPYGFREIEHTADWALEVWAPDIPKLFEQAARGMYTLAGTHLRPEPRITRNLELTGIDSESLLVRFLGELLYLGENEGLGFDTFELQLEENTLRAQLGGAPIAAQSKEIKAVTYHQLAIHSGERGLKVRIVFDV